MVRRRLLPKIWLAKIPRYWEKRVPKGYPASSSEFSLPEVTEEKVAIEEMESKIGTEESIVSPDVIPEHEAVGNYLGSYFVEITIPVDEETEESEEGKECPKEGEATVEVPDDPNAPVVEVLNATATEEDKPEETPSEESEEEEVFVTLLSPVKVKDKLTTGAVAYRYNDEAESWDAIENVEVVDGYVYGTLEDSGVVATFTIRKDSYIDTAQEMFPTSVYVCNGIKTVIKKNEAGETVAISAYGTETPITEDMYIVGGSFDGSTVESTDVSLVGVKVGKIIGGSYYFLDDEHKNHTKSVRLYLKDTESTSAITGAGIYNCVDNVEIYVENCKSGGLGNQESFRSYKGKGNCSNKNLEDSAKGLLSNQWVKHSKITLINSEIEVVYCAGNNGHSYTQSAELYVDGGSYEWLCNGQSNGTVDNSYTELNNCKVHYLNNNNRGHYGSGSIIIKGCDIQEEYAFADPKESDKDMADIRGTVSIDIDANTSVSDFCVGAISNVEVTTAEEAAKYIKSLKVSRDASIVYTRNADKLLKDIIVVK